METQETIRRWQELDLPTAKSPLKDMDFRPVLIVGDLPEGTLRRILQLADRSNNGYTSRGVRFTSWEGMAKRIRRLWEKDRISTSASKYLLVILGDTPKDWQTWYRSTGLFHEPFVLVDREQAVPEKVRGAGDFEMYEALQEAMEQNDPTLALKVWCTIGGSTLVDLSSGNGHKELFSILKS